MSGAMEIIRYFFGDWLHFLELVIVLATLRGGEIISIRRWKSQ